MNVIEFRPRTHAQAYQDMMKTWVDRRVDQLIDEGQEMAEAALGQPGYIHDYQIETNLLETAVEINGPCALPMILHTLAEYGSYSDEERAILREAHDRVIDSDPDIYDHIKKYRDA